MNRILETLERIAWPDGPNEKTDPIRLAVSCGFLCTSWILFVVGTGTIHWTTDSDGTTFIGLWRICFDDYEGYTCFRFSEEDNVPLLPFMCSAVMVVSILTVTLSICLCALALFHKGMNVLPWAKKSGISAILSVILTMISACVYAGVHSSVSYGYIPKWSSRRIYKLSWSFYIVIFGAIILLICGTYLLVFAMNFNPAEMTSPSTLARHPSLLIHPPPTVTPSQYRQALSARDMSPLPINKSKMTPVKGVHVAK